MDRSAFLERIRARLARLERPELPPALPATMVSGDGRGFARFAEELAALRGQARRVAAGELPAAVANVARGCARAVVGADLGPFAEPVAAGLEIAGCAILMPDREGAAGADLGVTGAAYGVASTGSVLLSAGPDRARTTSLLPERHLAILPEERLLPGLDELVERLPELAASASQLVLVTGPSRTSDIEMTSVLGVHGPERVIVLVVGD